MDMRLDFRVLGPLEVVADDEPLALGGPQQRALLAVLLLNANHVVSRDRMVEAIWGNDPPKSAPNAVQVAVHGLRKVLGRERLETQGAGYRLEVLPGELDLDRLVASSDGVGEADPDAAARTLRECLSLFRGDPLVDFATPFFDVERERIEELRLTALERRIDADLELGRAADVVPELESLTAAHPYRERLRAQLMLALYRSGRQADALETYQQARHTLVEELGVEPSTHLQELQAAILRQDPTLDAVASRVRVQALPSPPQPILGRALDVAAVTALVRSPSTRLVTLTGPGGTGKTRLALEAAHLLAPDFGGAVFPVDLSPLRDPGLVASTIAHAVGVGTDADVDLTERIARAVAGRDALFLVDNFEHVLDAAPLIARLLAQVPELRVLATSREPLRIAAEHEYRVPPLALPAAGANEPPKVLEAPSVALFVARARAVQPDFEVTEENAEAIADICHALDGMPLALELAAARARLLSTSELRDRIEDRLGLLADGPRDLPARQRTLRSTIDWSYDLLDQDEQSLLARLAVFAGGWTLDAAERVCDATISELGSLVEKSLVRSRQEPAGTRFSMLEMVREYALERLAASGELDEVRSRHASYYGDLAVRLQPVIETPSAVEEAEREHDNIRVALAYVLEHGDGETALRLCMIARLWYAHGYLGEGSAWIERALALESGDPVIRARVLFYGAAIAWSGGDNERAILYGHDGLRLARDVGDLMAEVGALTALGLAYQGAGDLERSREFYGRSLDRARAGGDQRAAAVALVNIADIEFLSGNHDDAEALAREGLEIHRCIGEIEGRGVALLVLASSLLDRGSEAEAAPLIVESMSCFRRVGYKDFLVSALVALARVRSGEEPAHAARLLGAARTMRAPLGPAQFVWEQDWFDLTENRTRELLGPERSDAELASGSSAPGDVVDEVLAGAPSDPAS
jgi:predicted ATPase/DNA-binding SARP family transcriptional activator